MASSSSSSSSSRSDPSSSSRSYKYDVFLSFRGEDTRLRFVDHLHKALVEKSIFTFKDDRGLLPGQSIGPSLFTAIDQSQIAVIVFSENYADSSWCLEELTYIMKCEVERRLIVMPIFYDVEPTDVRKQKGKFGEAFARHEKEKAADKVESWRLALADASNNVGFPSKSRPETAFIQEIVDKIFDRLPSKPYSDVDEGFVGMTARMQDLKSQLKIRFGGVRMVGIWGVGGGGKTTLATSVFMEIYNQFEGSCIVENIREESRRYGLKKLQESILSAVFKREEKVHSVAEGTRKMKSMLSRRKVLVLLDDVDQLGQLEALAGSHNWFGRGSRIIITTRDEHLLKAHNVDKVCPLTLLSDGEAMRLFNKHAFSGKEPIQDYKTLSLHVVCYAAGLPLALKVLGSFLCGKNKEWRSALDRLKDIPEEEIVEKLKISYDGLKTEEKELFLDIACFFRGWKIESSEDDNDNNAREILEACGFHLEIGIKVLRQKALINIGVDGMFEMHDLVQEMGHFIVRREHPNNPEYHNRVWKEEEIRNMFLQDATKKNDTIEAIGRWDFFADDDVSWFCNKVSNMKKLRWLSVNTMIYDRQHAEDIAPTFLSNELRYICWENYPGISFPRSFQPMKLVVLKLDGGLQKELWKGYKDLPCLKELQLLNMKNLVSTPDFKGLPCLQKLTLEYCEKLEEIHPSLGNLKSLEHVNISYVWFWKLRKFPITCIVHMEKLQTLQIIGCKMNFAEIQANMESVGERSTSLTSISDTQLLLSDSEMRLHLFPRSLQKLDLSWCGLEDDKIISGIVELSNLEELKLRGNNFTRLDSGLSQLTRLKILELKACFSLVALPELSQLTRLKFINLRDCEKLVELPQLPSSVAILNADCCDSLTAVGDSLTNCRCLRLVSLSNGGIINDGDRVLESMLQGNATENGTMLLRLKGGVGIAKGFKPCLRDGNIRRLELPEKWRNEFSGFLICAVLKRDDSDDSGYLSVEITMEQVKNGSIDCQDEVVWEECDDDEVVWEECDNDAETWVGYISFASLKNENIPWWDQTYNHLSFSIDSSGIMSKPIYGFGVRLDGKKGESESGSKDSSQLSNYTPDISIDHVSPSCVQINFPTLVFPDEF